MSRRVICFDYRPCSFTCTLPTCTHQRVLRARYARLRGAYARQCGREGDASSSHVRVSMCTRRNSTLSRAQAALGDAASAAC
eukprot:3220184-Pleurochrysis_carterae.AAC.1